MEWSWSLGVAALVALAHLPPLHSATEYLSAPYYQHRSRLQDTYDNQNNENILLEPDLDSDQLGTMSRYLAHMLVQPWPEKGLPLLYIEDNYPTSASSQDSVNNELAKSNNNNNNNINNGQVLYESADDHDNDDDDEDDDNGPMVGNTVTKNNYKRNRYYRKYPWKRQNSRQTYDAENRYLCQPSKDDVFRLLVALHDARQGSRGQAIHFCNRKRPAHTIFTNIRFLGK